MIRMEDDGFTRVFRSKKQRVGGTKTASGNALKTAPCTTRVDGDASEVEEAMRRADERMRTEEKLLAWMNRELERALRGRPLAQVLILGNGNFDGSLEPGAVQLALALRIAESFPSAPIHFQDPQCTSVERDWLRGRGVNVRCETTMQPPPMEESTDCRLVFFIHNPHGLLEQLLTSEWESGGTARSLFVCNDYSGWTDDEYEGAIDGRMPATRKFVKEAKIRRLPSFDPFPFSFRDTALIYLPEDVHLEDNVE